MSAPSGDEPNEVDVNEQAEMSAVGDLEDRIADIDDSLLDELTHDARFESSDDTTPPDDELDFIQMTGLTAARELPSPEIPPPDLNPELPVKFAEDGVEDVDPSRDPFANGDDHIGDHDNPAFVPQHPPNFTPQPTPEVVDQEEDIDVAKSLRSIAEELGAVPDPDPDSLETQAIEAPHTTQTDDDGAWMDDVAPQEDNPTRPEPDAAAALRAPLENAEAKMTEADGPGDPINPESAAGKLQTMADELRAPSDTVSEGSEEPNEAQAAPAIAVEEAESLIAALTEQARAVEDSEAAIAAPKADLVPTLAPQPSPVTASAPASKPENLVIDPEPPVEPEQPIEAAAPKGVDADEETEDPPRRRRGRSQRRGRTLTALLVLLAITAVGGLAYVGWNGLRAYRATPEVSYARAQSLAEEGKYAEAAERFLAVQRAFPDDAIAADSLFAAAHALSNMDAAPRGRKREVYASALGHLDVFLREYPDHEKHARAITMRGRLLHLSGNYEEAIHVLGDPNHRARDPEGYLSSLRILAASFGALGRLSEADSAFMRAASMPNNYSPDKDYIALAELYQKSARRAEEPALQREYREMAVENWTFALRVAGLPRSEKRTLRNQIEAETARIASDAKSTSTELGTPIANFAWRPAGERPESQELEAKEEPTSPKMP